MYEHAKIKNDKLKTQLDQLLFEKKIQEEQIEAIEVQVNETHKSGNKKQKYDQLKEQIADLEKQKAGLEAQIEENSLSFPEARDRFLAKVKEDNGTIINADKRIREAKTMMENYDKKLKELSSESEEIKTYEQDKHKYEILYQRDKEMTEFIEGFEMDKANELKRMHEIEKNIVRLSESLNIPIIKNTELSFEKVIERSIEQIDQELEYKQTDEAKQTLLRVQEECKRKLNEFRMLDTLEEKMAKELKGIKERMNNMKTEIKTKFNINQTREEKQARKNELLGYREELLCAIPHHKEELNIAINDYELRKQKMSLHEQFNVLAELENEISQNEKILYHLKQPVVIRCVNKDHQCLKDDCLDLIEELRDIIKNIY